MNEQVRQREMVLTQTAKITNYFLSISLHVVFYFHDFRQTAKITNYFLSISLHHLVFVGKYTGIDWGRRVQGRTLLALTNVDK